MPTEAQAGVVSQPRQLSLAPIDPIAASVETPPTSRITTSVPVSHKTRNA